MAGFRFVQLLVLIEITHFAFSIEYNNSHQDDFNLTVHWINSTSNRWFKLFHSNKIKNNTKLIFAANESFDTPEDLFVSKITGLHLLGSSDVASINCTDNAGIVFIDITNLHLEQLHISGCGNEDQNGGVTITNCTHVTITRVTIERSCTTGLALLNTGGVVVIQNCSFLENGLKNKLESVKKIERKGGGVQIMIGNQQSNSTINITNCTFQKNIATEGGGLFLVLHEQARQNSLKIENTSFDSNKCDKNGGGLVVKLMTKVNHNQILIKQCTFVNNNALFGGGTAFLSHPGLLNNSITFEECKWEENSAKFGMAVDIAVNSNRNSPVNYERNLPSPVFMNCMFSRHKNPLLSDVSILAITGFHVQFSGTITFNNNYGSCIEATTTTLEFNAYSNVTFKENHGVRGAAIKMDEDSVIEFQDKSNFLFSKNKANVRGGAIFVGYTNKRLFFSSQAKCFLKYLGNNIPNNVNFTFEKNYAGHENVVENVGDDLYITYITRCIKTYILPFLNTPPKKKNLGNFVFTESNSERKHISTSASCFLPNSSKSNSCLKMARYNHINVKEDSIRFIPGKIRELPLKLVNDLGYEMPFEVSATVTTNNSVHLNPAHRLVTNNSLTLLGKPGDTALIRLQALEFRRFDINLKVVMDDCPPGYVYNATVNKCKCSNRDIYYKEIKICYDTEFQAVIQYGYWFGYIPQSNHSKKLRLGSSICPYGYCQKNFSKRPDIYTYLPENAKSDLSVDVCNEERKGVVCGSCRENRSVYYNSKYFNCGSNELCYLGWLFYILSELVPVALLFLVIIVFNISFTSGPLNGTIFFMQLIYSLKIKAGSFIWLEDGVYRLNQIIQFVYFIFNFNFFHVDQTLSYCLWEGATTFDLLAFKYVTILYSLVLIIVTVFLLRQCSCSFCGKSLPTFKGSIIHGLSALLIMGYSACTRVSLLILTPVTLHIGPDYRNNPQFEYVPYYNGDYSYLGSGHLRYAIPAIFFIITVTIIPLLLLLSYPLCYKLFALLRIDESKFVQIVCKIFPLEKIKPFFDSMQGAFKDRYRFFAGLYFLYRLVCLLSFALADTFTQHYTLTGVFLALMLATHGALRPYKKGWQNFLDACLFLNLFIINCISYYSFSMVLEDNKKYLVTLTAVQNVLILLPLVYLVLYIAAGLCRKLRSLYRHRKLPQEDSELEDSNAILEVLDKRDSENDCKKKNVRVDAEYKLMFGN